MLQALPPRAPRDPIYHVSLAVALAAAAISHRAGGAVLLRTRWRSRSTTRWRTFALGMSFRELGLEGRGGRMRAHRALALGLGHQRTVRRARCWCFWSARPCRWDFADTELTQLRQAVQAAPPARSRWRLAPSCTQCWSTSRSSSTRWRRHYARHLTARAVAAAAPPGAGATMTACASATSVGRLSPARHQPAHGADVRSATIARASR